MTNPRARPSAASAGALLADAGLHILGVAASIAACVALAAVTPWPAEGLAMAALGLYAVGLVAMLGCSAACHFVVVLRLAAGIG